MQNATRDITIPIPKIKEKLIMNALFVTFFCLKTCTAKNIIENITSIAKNQICVIAAKNKNEASKYY